jgi:hypothetical protein
MKKPGIASNAKSLLILILSFSKNTFPVPAFSGSALPPMGLEENPPTAMRPCGFPFGKASRLLGKV